MFALVGMFFYEIYLEYALWFILAGIRECCHFARSQMHSTLKIRRMTQSLSFHIVDSIWFCWLVERILIMIHFNSYTLPETNSLHLQMDCWKTSFLLGRLIFRCHVNFRECNLSPDKTLLHSWLILISILLADHWRIFLWDVCKPLSV